MRWVALAIAIAVTLLVAEMTLPAHAARHGAAGYIILFGNNSSASGGGGLGCTNQLVLDYSNSCALIGQAWGQ
jgi:predicted outer membrane repeat protein